MAYGPWTPEKVNRLQRISAQEPISLNRKVFAFDGSEEEVGDLIATPDTAFEGAQQDSLARVIEWLFESDNITLKKVEKQILSLRYGIGCEAKTLEEVGVIFKVTRERVRQIELKALRKAAAALAPRGVAKDTI